MTGDFDLSTAGNMKSLLFVVIAYASLVAVFVPAGVNGQQSNGDSECLFRLGLDNQCLDMFDTSTTSTEERAAFCNGPCAQSLAQGYLNCGFNFVVESIFSVCTANAQGRFCQDVLTANDSISNLTQACITDSACTGSCNDALQEFGCCASNELFGLDILFPNCNVSTCEPPFILGPPSPPPPTTEGTNIPFTPLLTCLSSKVFGDQDLLERCSEYIPNPDEVPTDMTNMFASEPDFGEFCASSCSERIAEAYHDCETRFGSFGAVVFGAGNENITYAQFIQGGCAKDNLNPSRVCLELLSDTSYGEQVTAVDGPCVESLARGDCSDTCRAAVNSLGCCIRTVTLFEDIPETRILDYCNVQPCAVPFELDGSSKAGTIHSAAAVLIMISAILSAIMVNV